MTTAASITAATKKDLRAAGIEARRVHTRQCFSNDRTGSVWYTQIDTSSPAEVLLAAVTLAPQAEVHAFLPTPHTFTLTASRPIEVAR